MSKILRNSLGSALLVALSFANAMAAHGQVGAGSITGTVRDSTGAVIPNADVAITAKTQAKTQHIKSNSDGRYVAPELVIGLYDITVAAPGFKAERHIDIDVQVGRDSVIDFSLAVGNQTETVTVEGTESQVETSTTEQSAQIGRTQLRELPLNGRNFEQLILLAPGVQQVTSGTQNSFYGRESSYSIAGSRPEGQALVLDGASIQDFWNHGAGNSIIGTSLGVDAIGEFQVLTNTYSARFGGSGSALNATTRSGGAQFHGSVYEFVRNSALDARDFFNTLAFTKNVFTRNQFGATLGGPVLKEKLFFFVNYEGIQQTQQKSGVVSLPDANARLGYLPCTTATAYTCNTTTGLAYVGLNAATASTVLLYPAPSPTATEIGKGIVSDIVQGTNPAAENYVNTRVDYTIGPKDTAFVRYVHDLGNLTDAFASALPIFPEASQGRNQYLTIGERRLVGAALTNDARFSFVRTRMNATSVNKFAPINFFPNENRQDGQMSASGLSALGPSRFTPDFEIQNTYSVADDVFYTHGNNTLEVGIEFRRQQSNLTNGYFSSGQWRFSSLLTLMNDTPASFTGALQNADNSYRGFREVHLYPYVQDTLKLTTRITLTGGLRWNFVSNPVEVHNLLCAFTNPSSPTQSNCVPVPNVFASNPSLTSFDPRVGFAFDPFRNHKTAIRGGIGLFHDPIQARNYNGGYLFTSPYLNSVETCGNGTAGTSICTYPIPFTGNYVFSPTISNATAYNSVNTPFSMQYNFNIQQQVAKGTVLSMAYVGSLGRNLIVNRDLNPPTYTTINGVKYFSPNPTSTIPTVIGVSAPRSNTNASSLVYGVPIGPSSYNSLQAYFTRNEGKSLHFQLAYTFSKCLDQGSSSYGLEGGNSPAQQADPYNEASDSGPCNFDVRQNFSGNAVYEFPFHRNRLVEGFQYSIIAIARAGTPFTVTDGFDRADLNNSTSGAERPDLVPGKSNNPILHSITQWYDPTSFQLQTPGTLGDLGRNSLVGPKFNDLDMTLAKVTHFSDSKSLQLRAEFFNILNHPDFGLPNSTLYSGPTCTGYTGANLNCPSTVGIASPTAGQITTTVNSARQVQFAAKFLF